MPNVRLISKTGEVVKDYTEQLPLAEIDPMPILNLDGRYFTYDDTIFPNAEEGYEETVIYRETDCHPVSGAFIVT